MKKTMTAMALGLVCSFGAMADDVPSYQEWLKAGKPLPEGMMFTGGTPWFDETTGKNRTPEEVYEIVYGQKPDVKPVHPPKLPARKAFPEHWGDPPRIQTRDYRELPGGYGMGSTTLANWIRENMKKDAEAEEAAKAEKRKPKPQKAFPEHWGEPPLRVTRDYVKLPGGYGYGSSTMANWIAKNMEKDKAREEAEAAEKAKEKKPFPKHWGQPPRVQTDDYRPLPDGYGMGSSTLYHWIKENQEKDAAKDARKGKEQGYNVNPNRKGNAFHKPYPMHWGAPPRLQTRDYRKLPGGYGYGSSTEAAWIRRNLARDAELRNCWRPWIRG